MFRSWDIFDQTVNILLHLLIKKRQYDQFFYLFYEIVKFYQTACHLDNFDMLFCAAAIVYLNQRDYGNCVTFLINALQYSLAFKHVEVN